MGSLSLVFEFKSEYPKTASTTLLSIPGQCYTIGSTYPGEVAKNEFIFLRWKDLIIHCHIFVDFLGKFRIENGTAPNATKVFVNCKQLYGSEYLKNNDSISFGMPRKFREEKDCPAILVKVTGLKRKPRAEKSTEEYQDGLKHPLKNDVVIILDFESRISVMLKKTLYFQILSLSLGEEAFRLVAGTYCNILSLIFKYLDISNLKKCCLVSQNWYQEARNVLHQKGTVSLEFKTSYIFPKHSIKVFQFINSAEELKLKFRRFKISMDSLAVPEGQEVPPGRNVISTSPGEPGEKMLQDIKKFLNFQPIITSLTLTSFIYNSQDFSQLQLLLQTFGSRLRELKFENHFTLAYFPEDDSTLQIPLTNLKKFSHHSFRYTYIRRDTNERQVLQAFIHFTLPIISNSLEEFSCTGQLAELYFEEIIEMPMPNLKHVEIVSSQYVPNNPEHLFLLEIPLTSLVLECVTIYSQDRANQLNAFLKKQANSLEKLKLVFEECDEIEIVIPPLKKLKEFNFGFIKSLRVRFESEGGFDYKEHFPEISILEVHQKFGRQGYGYGFPQNRVIRNEDESQLFNWEKEGSVFTAFFPGDNNTVCETVRRLMIPAIESREKWGRVSGEEYKRFLSRLCKIADMFPNVATKAVEGLGFIQPSTEWFSDF